MKLVPKKKWIVGRVVDVQESKGGIALASSDIKNVTVMLLVDQVGPDVTSCAVGDTIIFLRMNHVFLRDGTHYGVVLDDESSVICTVEGLEEDGRKMVIEGQRKRIDGQPARPEDVQLQQEPPQAAP